MDPGAAPGASTKYYHTGAKQHRQAFKEVVFTQHDSAVIGSKTINANDNFAFATVAANDNFAVAKAA